MVSCDQIEIYARITMQPASRLFTFRLLALFLCLGETLPAMPAAGGTRQDPSVVRNSVASTFRSDFETVWQLVRDRFHDPALNGADWKKIGDLYRARLADVKTKFEFEALINRMLTELHASHAAYVTDDDIEFYMLPAVLHQDLNGHQTEHIGVMGSQEGSEFVVAGVLEGGPGEAAGMQSGDRLVSADGQPFRSAGSFRGKEGKAIQLQYKRIADATLRTAMVTPVKQNILRAYSRKAIDPWPTPASREFALSV